MRDMKCTLAEAHLIALASHRSESKKNSEEKLPDISKMIPIDCAYNIEAVESALYNLDEFIQERFESPLKWETIILIYGTLSDSDQVELMFDCCDTDVRESIADAISRFLIGRTWPMNGTSIEETKSWKILIRAAVDKYSRPQEYLYD